MCIGFCLVCVDVDEVVCVVFCGEYGVECGGVVVVFGGGDFVGNVGDGVEDVDCGVVVG